MFEDLSLGQRIFMVILFILTIISLFFGGFAIYNMLNKEKPWTLGVTYASYLESSDDETSIISINVHSNENKNGEAVYDFRINSYTDSNGTAIAGFGIQCVGDWKILNNSSYRDYNYSVNNFNVDSVMDSYKNTYGPAHIYGQTVAFGNFYFYYTGDDGEIYTKTSLNEIPNYMLIDIDGSYYRILLKDYSCKVRSDNFWAFLPGVPDTKTINTSFSWFELFDVCMKSAMNTNATNKYEVFSLALTDLSNFITIQYKDEKGQYHNLQETSDTRNYFDIKVNYSKDGLLNSNESMFGMVKNSSTWSFYGDLPLEDYWNSYSNILLTEKYLNYVYDEGKTSYYAVIDKEFADYLINLSYSEISCCFDFSSLDFDIYAIDLKNFSFNIKEFNIITVKENFVVYNQAYCKIVPNVEVVV